jgi:hypothetical protein
VERSHRGQPQPAFSFGRGLFWVDAQLLGEPEAEFPDDVGTGPVGTSASDVVDPVEQSKDCGAFGRVRFDHVFRRGQGANSGDDRVLAGVSRGIGLLRLGVGSVRFAASRVTAEVGLRGCES